MTSDLKPDAEKTCACAEAEQAISPLTPVTKLPLRRGVRKALHGMGVYCLNDLSAVSQKDLSMCSRIGRRSISSIHELLKGVGLTLATDAADTKPLRPSDRGLGAATSAPVTMADIEQEIRCLSVADLGLHGMTLKAVCREGYQTVGDLMTASTQELVHKLYKTQICDVLRCLQDVSKNPRRVQHHRHRATLPNPEEHPI